MTKAITLTMLIEKNACQAQVELFKKYFGESVEITEYICLKYYDKFDVDWLFDNMMNEKQYALGVALWGRAYDEYETKRQAAWATMENYNDLVDAATLAIEEPAWEAFQVGQRLALTEYADIKKSAHTKYKREEAMAFCIAYNA